MINRKMIAELLSVIIERNKLIDSLKQMIILAQAQLIDNSEDSYVGEGNLGDFVFEENLARDLGMSIVAHTQTISKLIQDILKPKNQVPGVTCNEDGDGVKKKHVFVFKGTDYDIYQRRETN